MTSDTSTETSTGTGTETGTGTAVGAGAGPVARADLLALTADYLATLANRGLVKRAAKELAAGTGASVTADEDGALVGGYPDGTTTRLAAGAALAEASCSCAATGLCRHRIGLVLAYQQQHSGTGTPTGTTSAEDGGPVAASASWSPGAISDEALVRVFGARPIQEARRNLRAGYHATVHRPEAWDARGPRVELPTCTVTFHVAGDPAYATTDAVEQRRAEAVALAVWAFRTADEQGLDGARAQVDVGGVGTPAEPGKEDGAGEAGGVALRVGGDSASASAPPSGADESVGTAGPSPVARRGETVRAALAHAAEPVEALLLDGVSSTGPLAVGNLRRAARDLAAASLIWPAAVLDELVEQLDWYLRRNARHELSAVADLATELLARCRAAAAASAHPDPARPSAGQVLGTGESARTPLRRIRLVGLGCRILGGPRHRTAELYFVHPADGTVLVLRREWRFDPDDSGSGSSGGSGGGSGSGSSGEQPPTGHQLRTRRVAGSPLHMLAACNLISEAASRSASRTVELGVSRLAKTTVTGVGAAWSRLPENVRVSDYAALAARLSERHPRYVRPRIEAEDVYVLTVDRVAWVGYDPGAQCLEASVYDAFGAAATVRAPFRSTSPGALDALGAVLTAAATEANTEDTQDAAAADDEPGHSPLMISGRVSVHGGGLVVDPIAVWTGGDEQPVVPDLAAGDDTAGLAVRSRRAVEDEASSAALRAAADLLAEHAHRGLDRLGAPGVAATEEAAAALSRNGFKAAAALLADYGEALAAQSQAGRPARVRAWADACILVAGCLESTG